MTQPNESICERHVVKIMRLFCVLLTQSPEEIIRMQHPVAAHEVRKAIMALEKARGLVSDDRGVEVWITQVISHPETGLAKLVERLEKGAGSR